MMFAHYLAESKNSSIAYINKILDNLKGNLRESSYKNNERAFQEILFFFRGQAFDSLRDSSVVYTQIISIPGEVYTDLSKEYKRILIEVFTIRFIENISIINFSNKYDIKYLEITYWGFLKLIKKVIDENDYDSFNLIFEKANESISFEISKREEAKYYHYAFCFSVLSWIFYLHQQGIIKADNYNLSYIEEIFEHNLYHNKERFINNFYRFENEATNGLFEIDNWEIKKGPIGKAYFVLMSHTWLNFGFLIILLKYNILNYGVNIDDILLNDKFKFIVDDVKHNLALVKDNPEKWDSRILNNFEEEFDFKQEKIIEFYTELNKRQEILRYGKISNVPLSELKIAEFKKRVGDLWVKNSFIPAILKFYDRVTHLPNKKEKDGFGFFQNMLKMRFAFVEGEHHQTVYGLTDFGAKVANLVNEYFFIELLKLKEPKEITNLKNEVDVFLSKIGGDHSKVVIFSNWRANKMLSNDGNLIQSNEERHVPFSNSNYKNIPIINSTYSNFVFLIDLKDIEYTIYEDEKWYNNELLVEVTEPKFDNIENQTEKEEDWKEREGVAYSKDEIITLEKNDIYIKILFKFDLNVLKKKSFEIYKII